MSEHAVNNVEGVSPLQKWLVLLMAIVFAAFPLAFALEFEALGVHLGLEASAFFFSLAFLPGAIGIVYHLASANAHREREQKAVQQYYKVRDARPQAREHERNVAAVETSTPSAVTAISSSLFLTGIFLLIAVFAGYHRHSSDMRGVQGMMYAGLGAYVAVLYYMVGRIYANALSPRFLMTSALRTASAVAIGWVLGTVGVGAVVSGTSASENLGANSVLFLVGLFHNWAINALRTRAMKLFGAEQPETFDVPIESVEGINDTTVDLLNEYGISTVQHLATSEPGELCDRTLLPMERILDWIDQAILVRQLGRLISVARPLGLRGSVDLALAHVRANGNGDTDSAKLIASLAEKAGLPPSAVANMARSMREDYMVNLIYELRHGRSLESETQDKTAAAVVPVTSDVAATPRLQVSASATPASSPAEASA
ncbi:MAG TPA: hypothetical protein VFN10_02650 [Thermoanaerobaculia bacterium]|nr:hypothetical protein [Thermoanaerobaculia bacterium]